MNHLQNGTPATRWSHRSALMVEAHDPPDPVDDLPSDMVTECQPIEFQ